MSGPGSSGLRRAGLSALEQRASEPADSRLRSETGVTAAAGFLASGLHCGIRRSRPDLALIVSDRGASAAAVFTRNRIQAAPILQCREALESTGGRARAVVVNAGNANACTGERGEEAALATAREAGRQLGVEPREVLVASTGVIGQPLPVERILEALPRAVEALAPSGGRGAAEAILTTDTCTKESVRRVESSGGSWVVGGMAKGSGMIHPDMATTLGFVTTDASVPPELLRRSLRAAVDRSFNRITVDGDTSTNDMVAVLANGASGVKLGSGEIEGFERALEDVLVELARAVVRDGEGATKLVTVEVSGATSDEAALAVARSIAGSALVKTALHGADANWGRVVAAAGRSGVDVDGAAMTLRLDDLTVLSPGYRCELSEDEAALRLSRDEVVVALDLGGGAGSATTWTCDLSARYVEINASYRT